MTQTNEQCSIICTQKAILVYIPLGLLQTNSAIKRSPTNPVLTAREVPYRATLIFNAGVAKFNGNYIMVFRNDDGSTDKQTLEDTSAADTVECLATAQLDDLLRLCLN